VYNVIIFASNIDLMNVYHILVSLTLNLCINRWYEKINTYNTIFFIVWNKNQVNFKLWYMENNTL